MASRRRQSAVEVPDSPTADPISFGPDDYEIGGLLDNVYARMTNPSFRIWDYGGKGSGGKRTFFYCDFVIFDGDTGEELETIENNYWSAAQLEEFVPSEDGFFMLPVGKRTKPVKDSNFHILVKSIANAGLEDPIKNDSRVFDGIFGLWERQPAPKRNITNRDQQKKGGNFAETIMCLSELADEEEWSGALSSKTKGGRGKPSTSSAGASSDAADASAPKRRRKKGGEADDDVPFDKIAAVLLEKALDENNGQIEISDIRAASFKHSEQSGSERKKVLDYLVENIADVAKTIKAETTDQHVQWPE